ncbi:MAG TPA: PKD domain-containing protein, partial [Chitinophagales bacterium]|nr:PKD domain-containing protein [Chitinophagales bacterium]
MKHIYHLVMATLLWAFAITDSYAQPCNPQLAYTTPVSSICIDSGSAYSLCLYNASQPSSPSPKWQINGPGVSFGLFTGDSVCVNLSAFGDYSITMMGDYGANCKDTVVFTNAFTLKRNPSPCFYADDTISCLSPFTVNFTNCSTSPPGSTCYWTFGYNTNPSTTTTCSPPPITFSGFGSGTVSLTIATPQGCTKSLVKPNYIRIDTIIPDFYVDNAQGCVPLQTTVVPVFSTSSTIASYDWYMDGTLLTTGHVGVLGLNFTNAGSHSMQLTVVTADGCVSSTYKDSVINVAARPFCSLTVNDDTVCAGAPVVFNLIGANCQYDTLRVHYGDETPPGTISIKTAAPFNHTYLPGEYDAWVVPSLYTCAGDTQRVHIVVRPPSANFTSQTSCLSGDTVSFINTSVGANRYHWQFNCVADTFNIAQPKLLLPHCDTCRVSLTAYNDANGCNATSERFITTACGGVEADFAYTFNQPSVACGITSVTFTNTTPGAAAGQTIWDWNGNIAGINSNPQQCNGNFCSLGQTAQRTLHPGYNEIVMVYIEPGGCKDTVIKYVTVCKLSAYFTYESACSPDSFHFRSFTPDPTGHGCDSIVSYNWSFSGNGSGTSALPNPALHLGQGSHIVNFTATNAMGCTASSTQTIWAGTPVYVDIVVDTIICPGSTICITNNTTSDSSMIEAWWFPGSNIPSFDGHIPPCITYNAEGDYQIRYQVVAGGCDQTRIFNVHVHSPVLSGYLTGTIPDCPSQPFVLCGTNTSQWVDSVTDVLIWDFGYGETTEPNPCNFYTFPGCNPVTLSVITDNGCRDTVTIDTVCTLGPRVLSYTVSPTSVCQCGDTVTFTISTVEATQATFLTGCNQGFEILNIAAGTEQNPTVLVIKRVYCIQDSCQPQILVGNAAGCQTLLNMPWIYVDTPSANFEIGATGACAGAPACFVDSTQHTYGGSYTNSTWLWDFADPYDNTQSTTQSPCHIYTQPGFYPVTLIIEPYGRCSDTITKTVEVRPKPTASFSYAQTDSCAMATYCFTDLSTPTGNVPISAWQWCYSGGNCENTTTGTTCHSFAAELTYPVTLTITDNEGCSNETTMNIAVNAINHIDAIPEFSVVDSCNFSIVCATDLSIAERPITSRTWTLAGVQSTAASPCFTSPTAGNYPLTLWVADATGCYSQDTIMVTTNPYEPDAAFTYDVINYTVNFTNQSTNTTSLQWSFGDGITSDNTDPSHTYSGPGTYTVTLLAGSGGCYDTASATIVLDTVPVNIAYDTICGIVYMDEFGNGTYDAGTDVPQSGATVSAGTYTTTT